MADHPISTFMIILKKTGLKNFILFIILSAIFSNSAVLAVNAETAEKENNRENEIPKEEVKKKKPITPGKILRDLSRREWYKQKKDAKPEKRETSSLDNEEDLSGFKKSASDEIEYVCVLLSEIPVSDKKAIIAPAFLVDKKSIWKSETDFNFKWVGYKFTSGLRHKKFPWDNTTLSETIIGSFLYASGTNIGFSGGKVIEENRFYTNYTSQIVTLKCQMPLHTGIAFTLDSRQYFFVKREPPPNFILPKDHVNIFPRLDLSFEILTEKGLDQLTNGIGIDAWAGYGIRSRWEDWGDPSNPEDAEKSRRFVIYCFTLTGGLLFLENHNIVLRARYKGGRDNDFLTRPRFGGTIDNAKLDLVHGFTVDEFRVNDYALVNLKYGFNLWSRLRMNLFLDYAHIFSPGRQDIFGSGYGFRILAFGGLPIWITHGIGRKLYPRPGPFEHTVLVMTAAGW